MEHTVRCGARAQANRCRAPETDGEERCVMSSRIGWRPRWLLVGRLGRRGVGGQEVGSRFEGKGVDALRCSFIELEPRGHGSRGTSEMCARPQRQHPAPQPLAP